VAAGPGGVLVTACRWYPFLRLGLFLIAIVLPRAALADGPNVLIFVTDDHGFPYAGYMGHPIVRTPALDALASSGVLFPVTHNGCSSCIPSRMVAATGLYPYQLGTDPENFPRLLPVVLRQHGYATFGAGKIRLPLEAFDVRWDVGGLDICKKFQSPYLQPFFDWAEAQTGPWLAILGPILPHKPYVPMSWLDPWPYAGSPSDPELARYFGNVTWMDRCVGSLTDWLDARGLRSNTLVLTFTDNGFMLPNSKHAFTENGYRAPLIVSMPGTVVPTTLPHLTHMIDVVPTVFDYVGVPIPPDLQGRSLRPLLEGGSPVWRQYLFGQDCDSDQNHTDVRGKYLRTADGFKLYQFPLFEQLYDLNADPNQTTNLIFDQQYVARVIPWRAALLAWPGSATPSTTTTTTTTGTTLAATTTTTTTPGCL
jgi:arylsulfatase A-like enzyme